MVAGLSVVRNDLNWMMETMLTSQQWLPVELLNIGLAAAVFFACLVHSLWKAVFDELNPVFWRRTAALLWAGVVIVALTGAWIHSTGRRPLAGCLSPVACVQRCGARAWVITANIARIIPMGSMRAAHGFLQDGDQHVCKDHRNALAFSPSPQPALLLHPRFWFCTIP